MSLPSAPAQHLSLFRSQISNKRFNNETLRILESILVAKDVKSLTEAQSNMRDFLRSESLSVIHEIKDKTVEQKLCTLEFFVRAFALINDIESCLALKYEGLLLRELKCASYQWLRVSHEEWLGFAEQLFDNGFYSIAIQACENAMSCLQKHDVAEPNTGEFFEHAKIIETMERLKDCAVKFAAPSSVQAQGAEYMKKKTVGKNKIHSSFQKDSPHVASILFRKGIKKRNVRKLHKLQSMQQISEL